MAEKESKTSRKCHWSQPSSSAKDALHYYAWITPRTWDTEQRAQVQRITGPRAPPC